MLLYNNKKEMVQEVQQQWNRYQEPNRIEGIWFTERKVSDHSQVRDKFSNKITATSNPMQISTLYWEVFASSWTFSNGTWVDYRDEWGAIAVPLYWSYLLQIIPIQWASSQNWYYYKLRIYVEGELVYTMRTNLAEHVTQATMLNLGKRGKITASMEAEFSASLVTEINLILIKL